MGEIEYVKYRVIKGDSVEDGHECLIVIFHSCCHLLSLDPEKEWTAPTDSVRTIKAEDDEETKRLKSKYHKIAKELRDLAKERDITIGSIWRGVKGMEEYNKGRLIKVVHINGSLISWRYLANAEGCPDIELNRYGTKTTCDSSFLYCFEKVQDNDNGAIYQPFDRVHDAKENPGKYQMAKVVETNVSTTPGDFVYGTIKYTTIPVSSSVYSVNLEDFHSEFELFSLNPAKEFCVDANDPNYSRKLTDPSKGENKMENSKETYLKTDASKLKDFGTGAKREDKTGKGRYDLIPGDVMSELEDFAWETYFNNGSTTCSATDVSKSAYFDDWANVELYYDFIVNVISYFFAKDRLVCLDDCSEISYEINWYTFRSGLYEMRKQLALHYEAGAVVHGVDNWKKGLPVYGSERGGCFLDSMRRHIDQALMGLTDEPHAVAALWNAFCAVWTLKNKPENTTNSSETKPEAPDKIADAPTVSYSVLVANVNNCVELLSKMLVDNGSTHLKFETHEAYINLYMICVLLKSVLCWFHDNDKGRVCIEHLISGIYDLINTNLPSVRRIFNNAKAEWVGGYDEVYAVCLGEPDKYRILGMIDLCCRTGMMLMNDDHFCGRSISNGILLELKEHLSKLIKE
jgi:hypothetical protein